MDGVIGNNKLLQVGFIVKDIEKSKRVFAKFFGVEPPENVGGGEYEITGTTYYGKPAPDANCMMAFFNAGPGVQIELIQPNGVKSVWQDFLDEHGEGIHHIAFGVVDMDGKVKACEDFGMKCVQRGKYGNGAGEYAYLDAYDNMLCLLELLENY